MTDDIAYSRTSHHWPTGFRQSATELNYLRQVQFLSSLPEVHKMNVVSIRSHISPPKLLSDLDKLGTGGLHQK
jgi:hypothetical protein